MFSQGVLEGLKRDFLEPPKTDAEVREEGDAEEEGRKVEETVGGGWMSRFKKVQSTSSSPAAVDASATPSSSEQAKDTGADDPSSAKPPPFASGHGNDSSGVAGSTSAASSHINVPAPQPSQQPPRPAALASRGNFSLKNGVRGGSATASAPVPKRRMRAEDMFGDSDEE